MAASEQHNCLVGQIKNWVENHAPYNKFYNCYDLPHEERPGWLSTVSEPGISSIPDYIGYSDDNNFCALGEAKTEYAGQTIFDLRADKQIKAYIDHLKYYKESLLLIAVPRHHILNARFKMKKVKKEFEYKGDIIYFDEDGLI